jgi:hypothetical protein
MIIRWILSIFLCLPLFAAEPAQYVAESDNDLTTTARGLTIQQPASPTRIIRLIDAKVYCESECVVTQKRDGTAATATAGTVRGINAPVQTVTAKMWTQSNVGAGTTIATDVVPVGSILVFDLSSYVLDGVSTANNFTMSTDAITGRVIITIRFREQARP